MGCVQGRLSAHSLGHARVYSSVLRGAAQRHTRELVGWCRTVRMLRCLRSPVEGYPQVPCVDQGKVRQMLPHGRGDAHRERQGLHVSTGPTPTRPHTMTAK